MDRVERSLRGSGQLLDDPRVTRFVDQLVCRLAAELCADVRVYVVRTPHFNATMGPNGVMQVWTGLLLRVENEAQLAFVLGHEIGHYRRRHSIQRWRDARLKGDVVAFFKLLTDAAGVGFVGPLADLVALGSVFAFSRDHEREADDIGLRLMTTHGYEPAEAPRIWELLLKEREAGEQPTPLIFFATHPPTEERIATLRARSRLVPPGGERRVGRESLLEAVLPVRGILLRDELRRRDFARTQVLLDRLVSTAIRVGELQFFQGELFRLRGDDGDEDRALTAYTEALQSAGAPAETHRAIGLLAMRRGEKDRARSAFLAYLEAVPGADDREMVLDYVERLR
jgi:predicted Zn-dependent protease